MIDILSDLNPAELSFVDNRCVRKFRGMVGNPLMHRRFNSLFGRESAVGYVVSPWSERTGEKELRREAQTC